MPQSAVQLFVLRDADKPLSAVLEDVASAGFDGVEFAYRLPEADVDAVVETLEQTGLEVAGAHVAIEELTETLDETLDLYRAIGCDRIIVPVIDESYFKTADRITAAGHRLSEIADQLDDGMTLHYHNHGQEFSTIEGETGWDHLLEATDPEVHFQLDIGLARAAGQDPVALFDDLAGRVTSSHFKDIDAESGSAAEFGTGDVELATNMQAATDAGVEWAVYEGDIELDDLNTVAARLDDARQTAE